jgi:hypothetical protein
LQQTRPVLNDWECLASEGTHVDSVSSLVSKRNSLVKFISIVIEGLSSNAGSISTAVSFAKMPLRWLLIPIFEMTAFPSNWPKAWVQSFHQKVALVKWPFKQPLLRFRSRNDQVSLSNGNSSGGYFVIFFKTTS